MSRSEKRGEYIITDLGLKQERGRFIVAEKAYGGNAHDFIVTFDIDGYKPTKFFISETFATFFQLGQVYEIAFMGRIIVKVSYLNL